MLQDTNTLYPISARNFTELFSNNQRSLIHTSFSGQAHTPLSQSTTTPNISSLQLRNPSLSLSNNSRKRINSTDSLENIPSDSEMIEIDENSNINNNNINNNDSTHHNKKRQVDSTNIVTSPTLIMSHNELPKSVTPSISANTISSSFIDDGNQLPLPSPSASPIQSNNPDSADDSVPDHLNRSSGSVVISTNSSNSDDDIKLPNGSTITYSQLLGLTNNLISSLPSGSVESNYLLFQLLQKTDRSTLSNLHKIIKSSLKKDLISQLPYEITFKIFEQFDYETLLKTSEVCKNWAKIAFFSYDLWKKLILKENYINSEKEFNEEFNYIQQFRKELNPAEISKLMYKRRVLIHKRWMNINYQPKKITLPGPGLNVITCLQFDNDKIAAGSDLSNITIYDTETGNLRTVLSGHNGGVWAMKYYKNTLASGSTDRTVRIWNINQGKCTHIFRGHISTVRCMEIIEPQQIGTDDEGNPIMYPESPLLITGSRDATLYVWKLPITNEDDILPETPIDLDEHNNEFLVTVLKGHSASVRAVTGFANILISGSYDSTARVWDLRTGECKWVLSGHTEKIYSCVYDVKRNRCYTGSVDNTVRIWDLKTGETIAILEGHQILVGLITSSDNALVSAAADSTVRIWDPDTGKSRSVLRGHSSPITCVQNDDYKVISGSQGMLKLWDTKTGKFVRDLLTDVDGPVWQVKFDYRRCITAVQKERTTFIEVLDFCPRESDKWIHDEGHHPDISW